MLIKDINLNGIMEFFVHIADCLPLNRVIIKVAASTVQKTPAVDPRFTHDLITN